MRVVSPGSVYLAALLRRFEKVCRQSRLIGVDIDWFGRKCKRKMPAFLNEGAAGLYRAMNDRREGHARLRAALICFA